MRVNAMERGELDALAARLDVPLAMAAKVAVRALLTSLNDSRPVLAGREEHLNRREVADVSSEYPSNP